jgi:DNA-binding transcriptional ArsR family regulator
MVDQKFEMKTKRPLDVVRSTLILKALAHPSRIRIIFELRDGGRSVGDLAQTLGLSQSLMSQHLRLMTACKLLSREKMRTKIYYSISHDYGRTFVTCLQSLGAF